jgi:Dual specificity phosphatase, catalytic domain
MASVCYEVPDVQAAHSLNSCRCCCLAVHCHSGQSRSVALVAAFLMLEQGATLKQALDAIREARPQASPNAGEGKGRALYFLAPQVRWHEPYLFVCKITLQLVAGCRVILARRDVLQGTLRRCGCWSGSCMGRPLCR